MATGDDLISPHKEYPPVAGLRTIIAERPSLQFIDASISFETKSPSAWCSGRILLLPVKKADNALEWKIWVLSTKLENLDLHLEDESLLELPGRKLDNLAQFETDVFIIGGGNA
ncbi:hypothetical protein NW759_004933 [Fusarium solani]|nr:hypothetical protein NW759_004933 [Fusarium solani]